MPATAPVAAAIAAALSIAAKLSAGGAVDATVDSFMVVMVWRTEASAAVAAQHNAPNKYVCLCTTSTAGVAACHCHPLTCCKAIVHRHAPQGGSAVDPAKDASVEFIKHDFDCVSGQNSCLCCCQLADC